MGDPSVRSPLWPFAAIALLHAVVCLYYFPPREIFSGEPLLTSDYAQRFSEASRLAGTLRGGSFWDYSTRWCAGFPDGFTGMVNNKPYMIALAATPERYHALVFNLAILASLWAFPWIVFAAAREFGFDRAEGTVAAALAVAAWFGSMLFRLFWRGGSIAFILGSAFGLWTGAAFFRLRTRPVSRLAWLKVALCGAATLWIHPWGAPVAMIIGATSLLFTLRPRGLRLAEIAAIASLVLALNLPWLFPFERYAGLRLASLAPLIYQGDADHLLFDFLAGPFHLARGPRDETAVLGPLLLAAGVGFASLRNDRALSSVLAASALLLACLAYGGARLHPLALLEPYRFAIPLAVVLAILSAAAVRPLARPQGGTIAFLILLLVSVFLVDRVRVASRGGDYLGAGSSQADRFALGVLRSVAAPNGGIIEGRILLEGDWISEPVEGRPGSSRVYYTFISLERYLDAEFVGAVVHGNMSPQSHASFWRGNLFGRDFLRYTRESFLRLCDLYDIRWVVTEHEATRRRLEEFTPSLSLIRSDGAVAVFGVDRTATRMPPGFGRARSNGREIEFESVDGSPTVLPYHWIPGLRARPEAAVLPADVDRDSPVPLLKIVPPAPGTYRISLE